MELTILRITARGLQVEPPSQKLENIVTAVCHELQFISYGSVNLKYTLSHFPKETFSITAWSYKFQPQIVLRFVMKEANSRRTITYKSG
jgi:hypothetical protein